MGRLAPAPSRRRVGADSAPAADRRAHRRPRGSRRLRARRWSCADCPRRCAEADQGSRFLGSDGRCGRPARPGRRPSATRGRAHRPSHSGEPRLHPSCRRERRRSDGGRPGRGCPAVLGRARTTRPTLSGEELAVDKVLAVFGRAEARDFHDLMAVESRYGLDRLCKLVAEKDRGFTPAVSKTRHVMHGERP